MTSDNETQRTFKQKVVHETRLYLLYFVYLALLLGSFTTYRRLLLAEYHIDAFHYGYAVIEALVLAKIILIGEAVQLGEKRKSEHRPLIYATLYKTVLFSLLVMAFEVLEHLISGAIHRRSLGTIFREFIARGWDEILARALVMFVAFIPLFAFRELGRVLGEGRLSALFFRAGATADFGRSQAAPQNPNGRPRGQPAHT